MILEIPRKVDARCCPKCGYIEDQKSIEQMKFNLYCPGCGKHKLSEFQPMKLRTGESHE